MWGAVSISHLHIGYVEDKPIVSDPRFVHPGRPFDIQNHTPVAFPLFLIFAALTSQHELPTSTGSKDN
jgi:hypothetical protein